MGWKHLLICLYIALLSGCLGAKRDNPVDPLNQPVILPESVTFDAQSGTVTLNWQYMGYPMRSFQVKRRDTRNGYSKTSKWISAPSTGQDPLSTRADVQPGQTYRDTWVLAAGEEYRYTVVAKDAVGSTHATVLGKVQISGAHLGTLQLNIARASADINWDIRTPAAVYELVRQVDDGPTEVLCRTEDVSTTGFTDTGLEGNRLYRYFMRSLLSSGQVLQSHAQIRAFYRYTQTWTGPVQPVAHFQLAAATALKGDVLGLLADTDRIAVQRFTSTGIPKPAQALTFLDAGRTAPQSVSLALSEGSSPQAFLVSVLQDTRRVQLTSLTVPDTPYTTSETPIIPWDTDPWEVQTSRLRTAITTGPGLSVFVSAGDELRIFNNNLQELGSIALGLQTPVTSLAVDETSLWVVLPEQGRVLQSPAVVDAAGMLWPPQWQDVALPPGVRPVEEEGPFLMGRFHNYPGLFYL